MVQGPVSNIFSTMPVELVAKVASDLPANRDVLIFLTRVSKSIKVRFGVTLPLLSATKLEQIFSDLLSKAKPDQVQGFFTRLQPMNSTDGLSNAPWPASLKAARFPTMSLTLAELTHLLSRCPELEVLEAKLFTREITPQALFSLHFPACFQTLSLCDATERMALQKEVFYASMQLDLDTHPVMKTLADAYEEVEPSKSLS